MMRRPTRMLSTGVCTAADCPGPPHWSPGFCAKEFRLGALLIALILSGGCGGDAAVGKVHGKVTLDGQPLRKAVVTFIPVRGGRQSSGFTDADGRYQLFYFRDRMGAQVGKHKISIHTSGTEETDRSGEEERVPEQYNDKTALERDVAPGDNEFSFDLLSR